MILEQAPTFSKQLGELIGRLFAGELSKLDERFTRIGAGMARVEMELHRLKEEAVAPAEFERIARDVAGVSIGLEDVTASVEEMAERVAGLVTERIGAELRERNLAFNERALSLFNDMEKRLGALIQPANGRDGEPGEKGEPGAEGLPGAPGRDGIDGVSPDPDAIAANVIDRVLAAVGPTVDEKLIEWQAEAEHALVALNERTTAIRDGVDGRDGADGASGKDGADGKDADPETVAALVTDRVQAVIEQRVDRLLEGFVRGPAPEEIEAMVAEAVAKAMPKDIARVAERATQMLYQLDLKFATLHGKDGRDGKDGEPGEKGMPGDPGPQGDMGVDGIPGPRGDPGEKGDPGAPGADGAEWRHLGVYDPEAAYWRNDVVAKDGGSFVACTDDPGPCPGDGWRMIAGRGRAGQRGEQGPRGMRGEKGDDGVGISDVVEDKGKVFVLLTDGRTVVIPWSRPE